MKKIPVILITSLISACTFMIVGFLSGAGGDLMLLLGSIIYGFVQFFLLQSESIQVCFSKIGFTVIIEMILQYFSIRYRWFYFLFIHKNPGYGAPNAGSGFAVLTSYFINAVIFIVIAIICIARQASEKTK